MPSSMSKAGIHVVRRWFHSTYAFCLCVLCVLLSTACVMWNCGGDCCVALNGSGYVFVQTDMSDETWHLIKNTAKVTNFLGGKGNKPIPITQAEIQRIMSQAEERVNSPKHKVSFEIGEQVRVCDGPFSSFNGLVEEIEEEKERLKVSVSIFGRSTPVDLEFSQVEKVK